MADSAATPEYPTENEGIPQPLGSQPLLPAAPLGQSAPNLQFMVPLGARSLSILDPSIFQITGLGSSRYLQAYRDWPFQPTQPLTASPAPTSSVAASSALPKQHTPEPLAAPVSESSAISDALDALAGSEPTWAAEPPTPDLAAPATSDALTADDSSGFLPLQRSPATPSTGNAADRVAQSPAISPLNPPVAAPPPDLPAATQPPPKLMQRSPQPAANPPPPASVVSRSEPVASSAPQNSEPTHQQPRSPQPSPNLSSTPATQLAAESAAVPAESSPSPAADLLRQPANALQRQVTSASANEIEPATAIDAETLQQQQTDLPQPSSSPSASPAETAPVLSGSTGGQPADSNQALPPALETTETTAAGFVAQAEDAIAADGLQRQPSEPNAASDATAIAQPANLPADSVQPSRQATSTQQPAQPTTPPQTLEAKPSLSPALSTPDSAIAPELPTATTVSDHIAPATQGRSPALADAPLSPEAPPSPPDLSAQADLQRQVEPPTATSDDLTPSSKASPAAPDAKAETVTASDVAKPTAPTQPPANSPAPAPLTALPTSWLAMSASTPADTVADTESSRDSEPDDSVTDFSSAQPPEIQAAAAPTLDTPATSQASASSPSRPEAATEPTSPSEAIAPATPSAPSDNKVSHSLQTPSEAIAPVTPSAAPSGAPPQADTTAETILQAAPSSALEPEPNADASFASASTSRLPSQPPLQNIHRDLETPKQETAEITPAADLAVQANSDSDLQSEQHTDVLKQANSAAASATTNLQRSASPVAKTTAAEKTAVPPEVAHGGGSTVQPDPDAADAVAPDLENRASLDPSPSSVPATPRWEIEQPTLLQRAAANRALRAHTLAKQAGAESSTPKPLTQADATIVQPSAFGAANQGARSPLPAAAAAELTDTGADVNAEVDAVTEVSSKPAAEKTRPDISRKAELEGTAASGLPAPPPASTPAPASFTEQADRLSLPPQADAADSPTRVNPTPASSLAEQSLRTDSPASDSPATKATSDLPAALPHGTSPSETIANPTSDLPALQAKADPIASDSPATEATSDLPAALPRSISPSETIANPTSDLPALQAKADLPEAADLVAEPASPVSNDSTGLTSPPVTSPAIAAPPADLQTAPATKAETSHLPKATNSAATTAAPPQPSPWPQLPQVLQPLTALDNLSTLAVPPSPPQPLLPESAQTRSPLAAGYTPLLSCQSTTTDSSANSATLRLQPQLESEAASLAQPSDTATVAGDWSSIAELLQMSRPAPQPQPAAAIASSANLQASAYADLRPFENERSQSSVQATPAAMLTTSPPQTIQAFQEPSSNSQTTAAPEGTPSDSTSAANIEKLAQAVYHRLRQRIALERERRGGHYSGRF
ncbi:hypothetical protein [Almyronema epifaneia]|uniref:Uncharacterized protein n=1 Tax=Almyronema epifaneia S1 TaxID=2991925 RepID=A0ABW6IE57_9CYAN